MRRLIDAAGLPVARFLAARLASMMASHVFQVGVAWQLYTLTGSALDLGLVGVWQLLPNLLLVFVAGPVVDRFERRRVLRAAQAAALLVVAGLLAVSTTGHATRGLLFVFIFLMACARAFEGPTQQALLSAVVPPHALPRAIALSGSTGELASIVGPAAGGLLCLGGPALVYGAAAGLLVSSLLLLGRLTVLQRITAPRSVGAAGVFAGFSYLFRYRVLFGAVSLDAAATLLGGAVGLFPIMARDVLHMNGAWGLGLLRSSMALGALLTAGFLARSPLVRRVGQHMLAAVAVYGLAIVAFGLSRWVWLSVAALVVVGAADMVSVVVRQSLIQLETPDHMRGRVGAANFTFISAANQLGQLESGLTATWLGPVGAVVLGGVGALGAAALWRWRFPELARRDRMRPDHADEGSQAALVA